MKPGILAASIGLIIAGSASADDWPTWRGPNRDGVSAEKGLPTKWSKDNNILWKVKLPGPAGSTPVIWGDRIFLTSPDPDRKRVLLICIGIDGKKQWEATVSSSVRKSKNIASASPTTDGKHIWTYCGTGDLVCFTVAGTRARLKPVAFLRPVFLSCQKTRF